MIIRVPDTLTSDNSEKYNVSIRLWSDGLSFSGYEFSNKDSFFSETVFFENGVSLVQSLKDIFFDNECFSYVYHSLYVVCVTDQYTLVPDGVFSERDKDLLFSYCYPLDKKLKVLVQHLKMLSSSLLFSIDGEAYEFLMRSLVNPQFIQAFSPLLIAWQKKSLVSYPRQMYAVIHESMMDIVCFEHGEMLFVNSFGFETNNDVMYFIMYIWKQLALNQMDDSLYICGEKDNSQTLVSLLKTYIEHVEHISLNREKYKTSAGEDLYMDVIMLTECGL